jgi:hypothetical protein
VRVQLSRDTRRWVVLDPSMLEDTRLSFRAKGLLAYLLFHPGLDLSQTKRLTEVSLEGVDAVETAWKELEEAGYLRPGEESDSEGNLQNVVIVSAVSRRPLLQPQEDPACQESCPAQTKPSGAPARVPPEETPAARIIERLNELRSTAWEWARYTPLSAKYAKNVEHINGRLSDGYSEADLVLVLEYLAVVDGGKEDSRKYFDCVTPFNTKNFERNLAMARDWEARGRPTAGSTRSLQLGESHDAELYEKQFRGGK